MFDSSRGDMLMDRLRDFAAMWGPRLYPPQMDAGQALDLAAKILTTRAREAAERDGDRGSR